MLRSRRLVPTFIVIMLTATPLAIAGWSGMGNYEPDTSFDKRDGWMATTPDTSATLNKVYFNGFIGASAGPDPTVGLGTLNTGILPSSYSVYLMMGVWKDCNNDGFIGFGDNGLWEYRSELLLGSTICPPQAIPDIIPFDWAPPHNDGKWVHEMLPLEWSQAPANDTNKMNLNDNGSRAWYDYGTPVPGQGGNTCWINPPTGSAHSTGGVLWWADCFDGGHVTTTLDAVAASHPLLAPLSFADHPTDQYNSASLLNQKNPWGDQEDASDVQAWDCSQAPLVQQSTPGEEVPGVVKVNPAYANVSAPSVPPSVNTAGSPGGTVNSTASGVDQCQRRTDQGGGRAGALAHDPYAAEADVVQSSDKQASDGVLVGATTTTRPDYCPASTNPDKTQCDVQGVSTRLSDTYGPLVGSGMPRNGGKHVDSVDGIWYDNSIWFNTFPLDTGNFGLTGVSYITYYGFVSPSAVLKYGLTLPAGTATGSYGSYACGSHLSGVYNGWDCDPANWWLTTSHTDGSWRSGYLGKDQSSSAPCTVTSAMDGGAASRGCIEISPHPGSPYNLRDVDCLDQSADAARSLGVSWATVTGLVSPAAGSPCQTAP